MDVSGTDVPTTLSLSDLLNATAVVRQKELADKDLLESIWNIPVSTLQNTLIQWALSGFPNVTPIQEIHITAPALCSDGVARSLGDYIQFCSGKQMHEHISLLQAKLPDITVAFSYTGWSIQVVVSRT
jgi:hypothetical protein